MRNKPLKILHIDDDSDCQKITARFLTFHGHMVETAENGREGLKKAAELKPDIILLDMCMPDMNGLQVMEALCADAATREIPVIMITGSSLNDSDQDSLRKKINFALLEQKPANYTKLLGRIETILQQGILNNRPALTRRLTLKRGAAWRPASGFSQK